MNQDYFLGRAKKGYFPFHGIFSASKAISICIICLRLWVLGFFDYFLFAFFKKVCQVKLGLLSGRSCFDEVNLILGIRILFMKDRRVALC